MGEKESKKLILFNLPSFDCSSLYLFNAPLEVGKSFFLDPGPIPDLIPDLIPVPVPLPGAVSVVVSAGTVCTSLSSVL